MEYPKFKVCCRCFTFNHSKYITDAMNGFTMQQTSFPFVCTIVDDASTDGEQEVIRKYVEENFEFSEGSDAFHKETYYAHITYAQHKTNKNCYFVVLYLKENHYSQKKPKMGYLSEWRDICEYEALCEGDDYWIVPDKLQKQVNYLDTNPKCGLVYTKTNIFDVELKKVTGTIGNPFFSDKEIYTSNKIATLTVCFRTICASEYVKDIPYEIRSQWLMGDYPLWLYISEKFDIYFIDETTSTYRANRGSASRPLSIENKFKFIECTKNIQLYFSNRAKINNLNDLIEKNYCISAIDTYICYGRRLEGAKFILTTKYLSLVEKMRFIVHILKSRKHAI